MCEKPCKFFGRYFSFFVNCPKHCQKLKYFQKNRYFSRWFLVFFQTRVTNTDTFLIKSCKNQHKTAKRNSKIVILEKPKISKDINNFGTQHMVFVCRPPVCAPQ